VKLPVLNSVTSTPSRLRSHDNIQAELEAITMHSPFQIVTESTEIHYILTLFGDSLFTKETVHFYSHPRVGARRFR